MLFNAVPSNQGRRVIQSLVDEQVLLKCDTFRGLKPTKLVSEEWCDRVSSMAAKGKITRYI